MTTLAARSGKATDRLVVVIPRSAAHASIAPIAAPRRLSRRSAIIAVHAGAAANASRRMGIPQKNPAAVQAGDRRTRVQAWRALLEDVASESSTPGGITLFPSKVSTAVERWISQARQSFPAQDALPRALAAGRLDEEGRAVRRLRGASPPP